MDASLSPLRRLWPAFALVALFLCVAACKGLPGPGSLVSSGTVIDQRGQPVVRATVTLNGVQTLTDARGAFSVTSRRGKRSILNITHPDFAEFSHVSRKPVRGQTWTLVRAQVVTVDATTTINLKDTRPELAGTRLRGASITIPPNSLVDARGRPPAGPVRAAIATLDVSNGQGPGDWNVRNPRGGQDGFLLSYGAFFVQFTDAASGAPYQLRSGSAAQISLPVLPSMLAHAPANASQDFWYYDGKDGYWKRNGSATYDAAARAYVGSIDHLSTVNTDIAKFTDAACLKLTLHPSLAPGFKLRLRYHSGGTPFGQTPTLVMDDTDNAMYRVPASTNVLLALFNAADEEIGNLVVEDPAGTDLVNTVVNTGPAIPSGHTLWPPPPFTDCKPIVLKLGAPVVQIRINELPADAAPRDNPGDDYLTWSPTFARARLASPMASAVTVVLTNDAPGRIAGGGDVLFAAYSDPWPVNTTATANELALTLPADGSWVPFVVAGKFGTPSTSDKDTIIEAHEGIATGALVGQKALMVRIRKNANSLTPGERDRFLFAVRKFRNQAGANYVRFQELHRLASTAGDEGHGQPAFLPWHRILLLEVERELQKLDPSVALPYWNWDAASPNLFHEDFLGAPDLSPGGFNAEPIFSATNPLNGWNTDLPFSSGELRRSKEDHTLAPSPGVFIPLLDPPGGFPEDSLLDPTHYGPSPDFGTFSGDVERLSHNPAHGWPCGGGHLTRPVRSAADPLFYFLHSQVERQWAYWQWHHGRFGVISGGALTFPAFMHYDNNGHFDDPGVTRFQKGSFLEDGQWPWDGTSGGTPGARDERPVNVATAGGTNIPLSMPLVPSAPFPASPIRNLWPATPAIPRPRDAIDYLGRFRPQDGLGFGYDDVPYQ